MHGSKARVLCPHKYPAVVIKKPKSSSWILAVSIKKEQTPFVSYSFLSIFSAPAWNFIMFHLHPSHSHPYAKIPMYLCLTTPRYPFQVFPPNISPLSNNRKFLLFLRFRSIAKLAFLISLKAMEWEARQYVSSFWCTQAQEGGKKKTPWINRKYRIRQIQGFRDGWKSESETGDFPTPFSSKAKWSCVGNITYNERNVDSFIQPPLGLTAMPANFPRALYFSARKKLGESLR